MIANLTLQITLVNWGHSLNLYLPYCLFETMPDTNVSVPNTLFFALLGVPGDRPWRASRLSASAILGLDIGEHGGDTEGGRSFPFSFWCSIFLVFLHGRPSDAQRPVISITTPAGDFPANSPMQPLPPLPWAVFLLWHLSKHPHPVGYSCTEMSFPKRWMSARVSVFQVGYFSKLVTFSQS